MRRPSASFVIPASISVALHATVLIVLPRFAGDFARDEARVTMGVTPAPDLLPPEPEPQPELAEPEQNPLNEFVIGDAEGKGFASHEIPDKLEATAPEADSDQAFLSLDSTGAGETGTDAAVASASGQGARRGQPGGSPPPPGVDVEDFSATRLLTPFGVSPELKLPKITPKLTALEGLIALEAGQASAAEGTDAVAQIPEAPQSTPAETAELLTGEVALSVPAEPIEAAQPSPNPGSVTPGGTQQPAADPARMSDSESDPFSQLGTVVFREGSLDIRFGRKIKTRRPKILLAGRIWDALVIRKPDVGLRIDIDPTGKVTSVVVTKSSGSNEIDQPTRLSVYEWWFEPKRDAEGQPIADQVKFVIGYR